MRELFILMYMYILQVFGHYCSYLYLTKYSLMQKGFTYKSNLHMAIMLNLLGSNYNLKLVYT